MEKCLLARFQTVIKKPAWLLLLALFMIQTSGYAQISVQGKVTSDEDNEGLPGVAILVQGTNQGTITDVDGNYSLSVKNPDATLEFSFIGYKTQAIKVGGRSTINVTMSIDVQSLEEIVVTGYGEQARREVTGAISQIKSEEIEKIITSDFGSAIQGQMAGVSVRSVSGAPGSNALITIRGVTGFSLSGDTFSGGADNANTQGSEPLYVVDGVTYVTNPNIAPQEIASIEVLKDGASAAIYGARASGGVILITTKSGVPNQTKITIDSYYGVQRITSGIELANTAEALYIADLQDRFLVNDPVSPLQNNQEGLDFDTDWLDELQVDNAPIQSHTLTVNTGKEDLQFNLVASYFSQDGVLINSDYNKAAVRTNTTFEKDKLKIQSTIGYSRDNRSSEPWALQYDAIRQVPYRSGTDPVSDVFAFDGTNPEVIGGFLAKLQEENTTIGNNVNGNIRLSYELVKGLTAAANIGGSIANFNQRLFKPGFVIENAEGEAQRPIISELDNTIRDNVRTIQEYTLYYEKEIEKHKFNFLVGNTWETADGNNRRFEGTRLSANETPVFENIADLGARQTETRFTSMSYLGRFRYTYDSRYMFMAVLRRDASSRFSPDNNVGWFPSFSAGWLISEEAFFAPLTNVVNQFKVRYGYGQTGSDRLPDYAFLPVVNSAADYIFGSGEEERLAPGLTQFGFADPDLIWETNISHNLGFDVQLLDGRINLTADIYDQEKKDMILPVATSVSAGAQDNFTNVIRNIGNMRNRGVEIAASYTDQIGDLGFKISGTFTRNRNKILEMSGDETIFGGWPNIVRFGQTNPTKVYKRGLPAGAFYLVPTDGIIETEEELTEYQAAVTDQIGRGAQLGDLKYVDVNGDSAINDDDRQFYGDSYPDFEYGINLNLNYKGFDLTIQFFGVEGADVYNGPKAYAYAFNRHRDLVYSWSEVNPTSPIPSPRQEIEHPNVNTFSDFFMEDGSYLRLRTVVLGYTLPRAVVQKAGFETVRFYASAQNLLTFTKYTGFDPEVASGNPLLNGIDTGKYPVSGSLLLGMKLVF
ncbi:TonB-dependent receptor [Fulvivirga sp. M361]|uniref:SusC/RagA family TonB-linked outer membrane protein n=1 Tax=Fulvivirga sp. M361 TaxID=2594266 RepID=UPI00117A45C4|nr:TonB-dependent receptor [Fulvivirga sp. M361]TRX57636.1 TonB-dependent receptor [Fulvivirga sp. M361]